MWRKFRPVIGSQVLATTIIASIAAWFAGAHGAISAALGGLISIIAGLVFVLLLAVWALAAPGAGGAGLSMWLGFAATQLYMLARLLLKLQFMASQTALFQRSLAHATYTAAPAPVWPESPAAEACIGGP